MVIGNAKVEVTQQGLGVLNVLNVQNNYNGTYTFQYWPQNFPGQLPITVVINGTAMKGSPFNNY